LALAGDLLASTEQSVSFQTFDQSMWGPGGPPVIDSGLLFAGTSWNESVSPRLTDPITGSFIQLDASTSGNVGVDFRAILDPGSIDASYAGQASLEVIELEGNIFTINSTSVGSPTGSLQTRSPNIDIESNFVFEVAAALGVRAEVQTPDITITVPTVRFEPRVLFPGTIFQTTIHVPVFGTRTLTIPGADLASFNEEIVSLDISDSIELLKITNQEIRVFEQDVVTADDDENLKFTYDIGFDPLQGLEIAQVLDDNPNKEKKPHGQEVKDLVDLGLSFSMGDITVEVPTLNLADNTFSSTAGGTVLRATGATNLAQLDIDADFLASVLFGLPPLGASAGISIGPISLFEFAYDLLDVDIGPQFSIGQDFEFLPQPMVTMGFNHPVSIDGQVVSSHTMPVGSSVDVEFAGAGAGEDLQITTSYTLANQFKSKTDLRLAPSVDFLALSFSLDTFLGPLFDGALFDPPAIAGPAATLATVFNQTYTLGGFGTVLGDTLNVDFNQPPQINPQDLVFASTTVAEGSPVLLSGSFVDPDSGQTHTVLIDWGDGSAPTELALAADVKTFADVSHSYSDNSQSPYSISVTLIDDEGELDDAQASITIFNVGPMLTLGGADSVDEGLEYALSLAAADPGDDTISEWNIDWGDGENENVAGDTTSLTHTYADGSQTYSITATATDEDGSFDATASVEILNVVPSATLSGSNLNLDAAGQPIPFSGVRGQTLHFTGVITDPGFGNPAGSPPTEEAFTFFFDWGDGTSTTVASATIDSIGSPGVSTTASFAGSHIYASEGTYLLRVTIKDDDGGETVVEQIVSIAVASMQAGGDLAVGGTTGNDNILIVGNPFNDKVHAVINGNWSGPFIPTNRLLAFAGAGNDSVLVPLFIDVPSWLDGGSGNDFLLGSDEDDVLLGGDGDDTLLGLGGRNLLVGGAGSDRIVGGFRDDLLIAGSLVFANPDAAIAAIMAEWTSDHDDVTRLANLSGLTEADGNDGFATRLNEEFFLQAGETVLEDADADRLTGAFGDDWFFFDPLLDRATDLHDEAFANDLASLFG
jgi:hypothetical protein